MSTISTMSVVSNNGVLQGFSTAFAPTTNPSGALLSRRGRLVRTLVVASLTVVMAAGFAAQSGAGDQLTAAPTYVSLVVPGGATLWSVASAYTTGDVQAMVEEIREVNNLDGYDLMAGQKLRIPRK